MRWIWAATAAVSGGLLVAGGLLGTPIVFAERVAPRVFLGTVNLGGISRADLAGVLRQYEKELLARSVRLRLDDTETARTLGELGVALDKEATISAIENASARPGIVFERHVQPVLTLDQPIARAVLERDFAGTLALPKNATLALAPTGQLVAVKSASGEHVDVLTLELDIVSSVIGGSNRPIDLVAIMAAAPVQDNEVETARLLGEKLLAEGMKLRFADQEYLLAPVTVRRLIEFAEQTDPAQPGNTVLGVTFNMEGLRQYLENTLAGEINREAVNARFEVTGGVPPDAVPLQPTAADIVNTKTRVTQFALPQQGRALMIEETEQRITAALAGGQIAARLAVSTTDPIISDVDDIELLGLTSLLAKGESDFAGSPRNRIHNIRVGALKYHGVLIPAGEEFSFNKFLGPVDAANGFLPELVIKQNVTVPEFGGGLCQVSTTAFRAAVNSGLKVTARRNHSYAVSYYGKPGFDATIYPPYTDLRFLNNTPGYILIQTRVEGTKLIFEFWGTDDGREVIVSGPQPYNRQPDGAVKATLSQTVTRNGEVIVEDTFYSNYKSPKLFPKVVSADSPSTPSSGSRSEILTTPSPTPSVVPDNANTKQAKPKPTPAPASTPAPNKNEEE